MTYEQAVAIVANHRKVGTRALTPDQRAEAKAAADVVHEHLMATDAYYRRDFRKYYNQLAVGTGRLDLVGKGG